MTQSQGTYSLLLELDTDIERTVGALGQIRFLSGYYAYTGSAFGPGGFARIDRHRNVYSGENTTRHWHIDYLLPHAATLTVFTSPEIDAECEISGRLPGESIPGFGASDCSCPSHLRYTKTKHPLETALQNEHRTVLHRELD